MPNKFRKAISVVKDTTTISLAKVTHAGHAHSSNLDVAVVKATAHEDVVEDRYVHEVVVLTSSSPQCASACVHAIARRITRTKNRIVTLKCLILIFKILQQGDPHFANEAARAMKHGATLINLHNFHDDSNSSHLDYTTFVRNFARFLEDRLGCCLLGKLRRSHERVCDMVPDVVLERIAYWQRLLDRIIATRPTGSTRKSRLVHTTLHSVVHESLYLYQDVFDGLALLLENFFQLQHDSCVQAAHICIKASTQFDKLAEFYSFCKRLGVANSSEYPSVKRISQRVLETLDEFLKDDAVPKHSRKSKHENEVPLDRLNQTMEENRERESKIRYPEENRKDGNEKNASESLVGDQDNNMGLSDMKDAKDTIASASRDGGDYPQREQRQWKTLSFSVKDAKEQDNQGPDIVVFEDRNKQQFAEENNSDLDLPLFDDGQNMSQQQEQLNPTSPLLVTSIAEDGCWEIGLEDTTGNENQVNQSREGWEQPSLVEWQNYQNPFLQDGGESHAFGLTSAESPPPPTFDANNPFQASTLTPDADPFSSVYSTNSPSGTPVFDASTKSSPAPNHQQQWMGQH